MLSSSWSTRSTRSASRSPRRSWTGCCRTTRWRLCRSWCWATRSTSRTPRPRCEPVAVRVRSRARLACCCSCAASLCALASQLHGSAAPSFAQPGCASGALGWLLPQCARVLRALPSPPPRGAGRVAAPPRPFWLHHRQGQGGAAGEHPPDRGVHVQRRAAHGVLGRLPLDEVRRRCCQRPRRAALSARAAAACVLTRCFPVRTANTFAEGAAGGHAGLRRRASLASFALAVAHHFALRVQTMRLSANAPPLVPPAVPVSAVQAVPCHVFGVAGASRPRGLPLAAAIRSERTSQRILGAHVRLRAGGGFPVARLSAMLAAPVAACGGNATARARGASGHAAGPAVAPLRSQLVRPSAPRSGLSAGTLHGGLPRRPRALAAPASAATCRAPASAAITSR